MGDLCQRIVALEKATDESKTLNVGNLEPKRAFVHVDDTVRALVLLAEDGRPGEVYNVSGTQPISVDEVTRSLVRHSTVPMDVRQDRALLRSADEDVIWGDTTKISLHVGWVPTVDFEQALSEILEWWRGNERPASESN